MPGAARSAWCPRVTGERRFDVRPSRLGVWAAPLMGMAFAFAWTPCIGPILGVVLGLAAHNGTLPGGVLLLFAYSLGLAVPFVLVGLAFGRLTAALTRARHWLWAVELVAGARPRRLRRAAADGQHQLGVDAAVEPPQRPRPQPPVQELSPWPAVPDWAAERRRQPPAPSCDRVAALRAVPSPPVLVALDGRSGAGKSTLAATSGGARTAALVIDGDDFYRGGDDACWEAMGPAEKVDLVIDWRRQRAVLGRLRRGERAQLAALRLGGRRRAPGHVGHRRPCRRGDPRRRLQRATASWPTSSACGCCSTSPATPGGPASCAARGSATGRSGRHAGAEAEDLYFEDADAARAFDLVLDGN